MTDIFWVQLIKTTTTKLKSFQQVRLARDHKLLLRSHCNITSKVGKANYHKNLGKQAWALHRQEEQSVQRRE